MAYTTINKSTDHFTTTLWTGDNTTPKTFTTGTFKPDFLWGKNRSQAYNHQVYDTTRGAGNNKEIETSSTGAEGASNPEIYGYVSAFTSTGFTATKGSDAAGYDYWNENPDNYVAWSWKANGGTTSSNSDGSITSTVQANTTAGFSIVKYTGTGANATVGHGLGAAPKMIIFKNTNSTRDWGVYHAAMNDPDAYLTFNQDYAKEDSYNFSNNTAPTSSVFSVGTDTNANESGSGHIAYCFAEKKGYSKFGSYTGNGNADGPFIYLGFKPKYFLLKNATASSGSSGQHWQIADTVRHPENPVDANLIAESNSPDGNTWSIKDFLSNGVKIRGTNFAMNTSGDTYIYMAFAEEPLVANVGQGIPATAR